VAGIRLKVHGRLQDISRPNACFLDFCLGIEAGLGRGLVSALRSSSALASLFLMLREVIR
jgi:hypothetical protein